MKQYWVFNESQLAGFKGVERSEPREEFEGYAEFDQFIERTGITIITGQSPGAFFNQWSNTVYMPPAGNFIDTQGDSAKVNYYNVEAHEVTHATGHPTRLNRNMLGKYGSKEYAEEEMIAEFGSVLLLHKFGIALVPTENSVYLCRSLVETIEGRPYPV
ncbi:zincin-like metallopeptidase domain-containing protein [Dyadobacter bucti]|uniref:zincin-like metallopeptidase domain-containing protein n=1 Tax=Dyadobacter bucti TaxID=2572203 RepID=UPI0035B5C34D